MNKDELRKITLAKREKMNYELWLKKSQNIFNDLINLDIYKKSKLIGIYFSFKKEVDTKKIIKYSLLNNKQIALPKMISESKIEFIKITNLDDKNLAKNKWNLLEPKSNKYIDKNEIDLMIIPLVVFDKQNNRIGYGKGYYDRYLENFKGCKIGLGFKEQLSNKLININQFDIKLDKIIFN